MDWSDEVPKVVVDPDPPLFAAAAAEATAATSSPRLAVMAFRARVD